jgi:hypothetical protein
VVHFPSLPFPSQLENLVLDGHSGHVKLTDFGLAKHVPAGARTYTCCGTAEYLAPEVLLNQGATRAVDYWALGIIVYEMLHGCLPFAADGMELCHQILTADPRFGFFGVSADARELIQQLLQRDEARRLGVHGPAAVLGHRFFASLDFEAARARSRSWVPPEVCKCDCCDDVDSIIDRCAAESIECYSCGHHGHGHHGHGHHGHDHDHAGDGDNGGTGGGAAAASSLKAVYPRLSAECRTIADMFGSF